VWSGCGSLYRRSQFEIVPKVLYRRLCPMRPADENPSLVWLYDAGGRELR
ncbi:unnamed protein product, partial [Acidithrix sp. C25]